MVLSTKKSKMRRRNTVKDGSNKSSQTLPADASPDSKCPICLDQFNNMAYLDQCQHRFCFRCIHEWSKNKAECPLCKQPFNKIFHSMKAKGDFQEFVLSENGSLNNSDGPRFRYRTTLTREHRQLNPRRLTSSPPDNGLLFEGLGSNPQPHNDRGAHRMMLRLAARRQAQPDGRSARVMQEQNMINFRRALYRNGMRVRSVRDGGRYRDISADFFRRNPACLHRLVPWLRRELTVLYGAHGSLINIVQHIIMTCITRCDMEDQSIQEELRPFLLTRTDHFMHEFISFARAPFSMEAYDRHAVYDCPAPSYEEGSSSDSSVITISADEADSDDERKRSPASVPSVALSQAPWDDETPGPSYSSAGQVQTTLLTPLESQSSEDEGEGGDAVCSVQDSAQVKSDPVVKELCDASALEEDCVIVGYVKPIAERTPELVQLSSDSEESTQEGILDTAPLLQPKTSPSRDSSSSSVCSHISNEEPSQRTNKSKKQTNNKNRGTNNLKHDEQSFKLSHSFHQNKSSKRTDDDRSSSKKRHHQDHTAHHRRHRSRERKSKSKDRLRTRHKRRSRSTDNWCEKSQSVSLTSCNLLPRGRRHSRSGSREYSSRDFHPRNRDIDNKYSRYKHEKSYSYSWDSYNSYSRERVLGDSLHIQSRSYCSNYYTAPDYRVQSRSSSRSHQDNSYRGRRRSRSFSSSSSQGSTAIHCQTRHEKPSGKRKYKTHHLESTSKERRKSRGSPLRSRDQNQHKNLRKSRSPSVVIVYEKKSTSDGRRRHKKKLHKKRNRRQSSKVRDDNLSPAVITIHSDSDCDHSPKSASPPTQDQLQNKKNSTDEISPSINNLNEDCELSCAQITTACAVSENDLGSAPIDDVSINNTSSINNNDIMQNLCPMDYVTSDTQRNANDLIAVEQFDEVNCFENTPDETMSLSTSQESIFDFKLDASQMTSSV
ncbi:topoisomerase I binding, arginine/serine-rich a [Polypterus senegalus]